MREWIVAALAVGALAGPASAQDGLTVRMLGEATTLGTICGAADMDEVRLEQGVIAGRILLVEVLPGGPSHAEFLREQKLAEQFVDLTAKRGDKSARVIACEALLARYGPKGTEFAGLATIPFGDITPFMHEAGRAVLLSRKCFDYWVDRRALERLAAASGFEGGMDAIQTYVARFESDIVATLPLPYCKTAEREFGPDGTVLSGVLFRKK